MFKIVFPNVSGMRWTIPEEEKYYEENGTVDVLLHTLVWPLSLSCRSGVSEKV